MTSKTGISGIPRWLWVMVAAAVLTQTATDLLRPMTSYKLIDLGVGETEIGVATAAFALLPLFFAMPIGRITGTVSNLRPLVVGGIICLAAGGLGLAFSPSVLLIFISSAILGVGHLIFTVGGQSMISRRSEARQMDANFGWFTAGYSIGQMAGPLLLGVFLGNDLSSGVSSDGVHGPILWAMLTGAVLSVVSIPVLFAARPVSPNQKVERTTSEMRILDEAQDTKPTLWRIIRRPAVLSHMFASLGLLAMLDILIAFMPLVGEATGTSPVIIGAILAIRGGTSVISRIFIFFFTQRYSRNTLVLLSLTVSAVTIALIPWMFEVSGLLGIGAAFVLMAVAGFFLGLGQPMTMTLISRAVPVHWRGSALAVRIVGNRIGQVLAPMLAGAIAAPLGPAGGIWMACVLLGISATERVVNKNVEHRRKE